jgi:hypothetical protein
VVDGWNKVPTDIKISRTVNSFKLAYKKRIGGDHMESQDWRKDEVDVLLKSTMVSERSK